MIGTAGWIHLLIFGLVLPYGAWRSKRRLASGRKLPPRDRYFTGVLFQQLVFVAISLLVAKKEWIPLFKAPKLTATTVGLTVALFVLQAAVGLHRVRMRVARRDPKVALVSPTNGRERGLWASISLAAGVGEEITYRGVFLTLLQRWTGSLPASAGIASVVFALAHLTQGWVVAAIVFGYTLVYHAIVHLSGSLFLVMAIHVAHDLWIGLYVGRLVRRSGWDLDAGVQPAAPAAP